MSASHSSAPTPEHLKKLTTEELKQRLAGAPEEAVQWIQALAEQGVAEAQVLLGQAYLDGHGLAPDPKQARIWFRKAAEAGDLMGMNMLGRAYDQGWGGLVDHACAAYWFRMAANQGLDWGMYNYANLLLHGQGVEKDEASAFDWYQQAASLGHAKSLGVVGRFFEEGWLGTQNKEQAFEFYRRSAEAGDFRGQYNYALMLVEHGSPAQATEWMRQALDGAHLAFSRTMAINLQQHPHASLRQIAREALLKCARLGDVNDMYAYARAMLAQPDMASTALGRQWLQQAAARGHVQAQRELAVNLRLS